MAHVVNGRDGQPKTLPLKDTLEHYIHYRSEVIERRTRFDLEAAEKRSPGPQNAPSCPAGLPPGS